VDILGKVVQKNLINVKTDLADASNALHTATQKLVAKTNKSISKLDVAYSVVCFITGIALMFFVQRTFFTDFVDHYFNKAVDARVEEISSKGKNTP
jgi:hypothetical protein